LLSESFGKFIYGEFARQKSWIYQAEKLNLISKLMVLVLCHSGLFHRVSFNTINL